MSIVSFLSHAFNWPLFGSFSLLFAMALAAYTFVAGIVSLASSHPAAQRLGQSARRAGMATFFAITAAALTLVWAALTNDFSLAYIQQHTNRALPIPYKLAALWSGQEGSLLFWAWLLSAYGFVLRLRYKVDPKLVAYASVVLAGIQVFFVALVNFGGNPFGIMDRVAADGNGLNALLQYPEMVIHPPMLYLGYVGMSVPFSFALAALIMKYPGEKWISITRRWTIVAWLFLTCGIMLGAHWAYAVLGWGGYWGWDPVENASLLPWLSGTAFLHSVMMQEKRGMMKIWNVWLIFITFLLSILGTFLTRSGIVSSVHAFAQSSIGVWFVWMLSISLATCLFFFIKNRKHLDAENKLESLVSRESSFLFNNLVLLGASFAVLWGTLFPILSEWVQGHKITVGPVFFNKFNIPIGLFLVFLTGIGPLLAWRSTSWASVKRNFAFPAILSLVVGLLVFLTLSGVWSGHPSLAWVDRSKLYSVIAFALSALVIGTICSEFFRGGRVLQNKLGTNLFGGIYHLTRRNTRRYGGYIAHFGFVVAIIGIAGTAFNVDQEQEMGLGDKLQVGSYTLVSQKYTDDENAQYVSQAAILDVYQGGKFLETLYPERRAYKPGGQPDTIVAKRSSLKEDLYVVYEGKNQQTDRPIIKAYVNPLVNWLWLGILVLIFGTGVVLVPNAAQIASPVAVAVAAPAIDDKQMYPTPGATK
ncbi:MAG TPA: heme lyase CcmF/NrfE family subunit [Candidatus Saccharimonadales bacterium]|jgi:cytochrome c-type biogenesis protein CcmF|nr:heme lyase CcmF/NrfE family subunit [Candidatus Saccharimonadales bacterium]